jgi:cytochrome c biogenesis factor
LKPSPSNFKRFYELLGSVRFAVSLLTVLGIASIIGAVLKQNEPYSNYIIQFGQFWFAFFIIATILGAMWAAEAWGGYWSWDPKETWALIVWLNYAAWLHLRMVKGFRGLMLAW